MVESWRLPVCLRLSSMCGGYRLAFCRPSDEVRRPRTVMITRLCNSSHLILCPSRINNALILPQLTTTRAPARVLRQRDGVHAGGACTDRWARTAAAKASGRLILESINRSSAVELWIDQRRKKNRRGERGRGATLPPPLGWKVETLLMFQR